MVPAFPNFLTSQLPNFHLNEGAWHPGILDQPDGNARRECRVQSVNPAVRHIFCDAKTARKARSGNPFRTSVCFTALSPVRGIPSAQQQNSLHS